MSPTWRHTSNLHSNFSTIIFSSRRALTTIRSLVQLRPRVNELWRSMQTAVNTPVQGISCSYRIGLQSRYIYRACLAVPVSTAFLTASVIDHTFLSPSGRRRATRFHLASAVMLHVLAVRLCQAESYTTWCRRHRTQMANPGWSVRTENGAKNGAEPLGVYSYFITHKAAHRANTMYKDTLQNTKYSNIRYNKICSKSVKNCYAHPHRETVSDEAIECQIIPCYAYFMPACIIQ